MLKSVIPALRFCAQYCAMTSSNYLNRLKPGFNIPKLHSNLACLVANPRSWTCFNGTMSRKIYAWNASPLRFCAQSGATIVKNQDFLLKSQVGMSQLHSNLACFCLIRRSWRVSVGQRSWNLTQNCWNDASEQKISDCAFSAFITFRMLWYSIWDTQSIILTWGNDFWTIWKCHESAGSTYETFSTQITPTMQYPT